MWPCDPAVVADHAAFNTQAPPAVSRLGRIWQQPAPYQPSATAVPPRPSVTAAPQTLGPPNFPGRARSLGGPPQQPRGLSTHLLHSPRQPYSTAVQQCAASAFHHQPGVRPMCVRL